MSICGKSSRQPQITVISRRGGHGLNARPPSSRDAQRKTQLTVPTHQQPISCWHSPQQTHNSIYSRSRSSAGTRGAWRMKGCICHFVKWLIHPFVSKGTIVIIDLQNGRKNRQLSMHQTRLDFTTLNLQPMWIISRDTGSMAYERVYQPLCKVADKPFRIRGTIVLIDLQNGRKNRQLSMHRTRLDFTTLNP